MFEAEKIVTTLEDLLHAINILGEDVDVEVDGEGCMAVVAPIRLSEKGRKYFADALSAKVYVEYDGDEMIRYYVSADDEKDNELAWEMFSCLAGYCPQSKFDEWFEIESKLI